MAKPLPIAIAGALGRMGRALAAEAEGRADLLVAARFDRPGVEGNGLVGTDAALDLAAVVVDFTSAAASLDLARRCGARGGPALVIGSTGWTPQEDEALREAALRVAIVRAGNFSLGLNVLLGLVRQAARTLPARSYDIEVLEAHHRRKVDAPSGTALMLGAAAAQGRGVALEAVSERARDGLGPPREDGAIGFAALKGGG